MSVRISNVLARYSVAVVVGGAAVAGVLPGCATRYVRPVQHVPVSQQHFAAIRFGEWLQARPGTVAKPNQQHGRPRVWGARMTGWVGKNREIGRAHVYRLLREGPDWLELETAGGDFKDHCMWRAWFASYVRLRLFARRSSAQLVTTRRIRMGFRDETWLEFAAGTPLKPLGPVSATTGNKLYRVRTEPYLVNTYLPSRRVGVGYVPSGKYENKISDLTVKSEAPLRFGVTGKLGVINRRYVPRFFVQQLSSKTAQPRVVVQRGCLKMKAQVAESDIEPVPSGGGGLGMLGGMSAADKAVVATLPVDTELHWPDGTLAGEVVKALPVRAPIHRTDASLCFELPLTRWGNKHHDALPLCVIGAALPADVHNRLQKSALGDASAN